MASPLGRQGDERKENDRSQTTKGDKTLQGERSGLDIAKSSFPVHGVDARGKVVIRQQLSRGKVRPYFAQLPACLGGLEA
jgi:hypothetical protein